MKSVEGIYKVANNFVAIEPKSFPEYEEAVAAAGGEVTPMSENVEAVIWTDYSKPSSLAELLKQNPQVKWVQLPFAGVDAFAELLQSPVLFTSAKGAYREPVAEHALALALALGRKIPTRVKANAWGKREAVSFFDTNIVLVGGGGITEELIRLLAPFRCKITVVRNREGQQVAGAANTVSSSKLHEVLPDADLVVIACALTKKTQGLFNREAFLAMKSTAFLVNVARGPIVVTDDLIDALDEKLIAGAALDVTDPEPLPDGHPLFGREDLIITPHTADTKEIVTRLFAKRVQLNVSAYLGNGQFIGEVDPALGY